MDFASVVELKEDTGLIKGELLGVNKDIKNLKLSKKIMATYRGKKLH